MKKSIQVLLGALISLSLTLAAVSDADARRLGGGRSFGSRPSYSQPYQRSDTTRQARPQQAPGYQSPAAQQNLAARSAMSRRGGLMGMLGGLALGGLLGAMLFGGAFEHLNLMDILVFGLIAFVLFKLFAARRRHAASQTAAGTGYAADDLSSNHQPYERSTDRRPTAGFDTDLLRGVGGGHGTTRAMPVIPADFDTAAFLRGAKAAYEQMQAAWDAGDLAGLRVLTTDQAFAELQDQIKQRTNPDHTELLKIETELLDVRDTGADREAAVLFDVVLREAADQPPTQVREVWHFIRPRVSKQPTWYLDGIQQVED